MKNTPYRALSGPPTKWSWYYRTLARLRAALVHAQHLRSDAWRGGGSTEETGELQDQEEVLAELAQEDLELSEVEAAIQRLRDGTYGICEATGKRIPAPRLRALPWTRFTQEASARRKIISFGAL